MLTASQIKSAYARVLKEPLVVRRYTGSGTARPHFDTPARGKATPYGADELIGTVQQGDQRVFIFADDLMANGFVLPVTSNDKVVVRGRELQIVANPPERKSPDGTLVVYEAQVRG